MAVEWLIAQTTLTAVEPVTEQRRRLIAIMLADVVGYSRMMSRSEDETHARFATQARELIDPTIDKYHGRLVRSMGDGLLVEFSSAVDAVRCAIEIQRGLATRQANEKDCIQMRIGINTGDVMVDHHDIYGNSVNIAARLEALASPGMVCVSQSIYDQTRAQPSFFFADRGTRRVKNIPYPVHVYEVADERIRVPYLSWLIARWNGVTAAVSIGAIAVAAIASVLLFRAHEAVARTNSIIVLPFKSLDKNTADSYLADAITDDLTTELSRLRHAWVIASGTAFSGRSSLSANQTTSFFLVAGFDSGAYSAKLLAGTKHRFSGLSQALQCSDDVFLMLVTGYPPARGGGGMPQRIITSSRSPWSLRTTGAG
jgi:adenylate cyclase